PPEPQTESPRAPVTATESTGAEVFLLVPWPCRCCCDGCTGCWRDYRDWTARIPRVRGVIPLCSLSWLVLVCTSLSGLGYLSGVLSGTGSFPRPVSSSR